MMELMVERADVWVAGIPDQAGGLARVLAGLKEAGADLDMIVARRSPEKPGTGVVFVTPLRGDREVNAAATLGFDVVRSVKSLRVEGENRPGIAAELAQLLAAQGLNLRGLTATVLGARFILYISFDSDPDAAKAANLLQNA